jgi:hypothetical protein
LAYSLGKFEGGDLMCCPDWPAVCGALQEALADPTPELAARSLEAHQTLFEKAAAGGGQEVQCAELLLNIVAHLQAHAASPVEATSDLREQQVMVLHAMACGLPELGWESIPEHSLEEVVCQTLALMAVHPAIRDLLGLIDGGALWLRRWMLTLHRRPTLLAPDAEHALVLLGELLSTLGGGPAPPSGDGLSLIHDAALLGALLGCVEGRRLLETVGSAPLALPAALGRLCMQKSRPDDRLLAGTRRHCCLLQLRSVLRHHTPALDALLAAAADPMAADPAAVGLLDLIAAATTAPLEATAWGEVEAVQQMFAGVELLLLLVDPARPPSAVVAMLSADTASRSSLVIAVVRGSRWLLEAAAEGVFDLELLCRFAALWAVLGGCGPPGLRVLQDAGVLSSAVALLSKWGPTGGAGGWAAASALGVALTACCQSATGAHAVGSSVSLAARCLTRLWRDCLATEPLESGHLRANVAPWAAMLEPALARRAALQLAQFENGAAAVAVEGVLDLQLGRMAAALEELALPEALAEEGVVGLGCEGGPGLGCVDALRDAVVTLCCSPTLLAVALPEADASSPPALLQLLQVCLGVSHAPAPDDGLGWQACFHQADAACAAARLLRHCVIIAPPDAARHLGEVVGLTAWLAAADGGEEDALVAERSSLRAVWSPTWEAAPITAAQAEEAAQPPLELLPAGRGSLFPPTLHQVFHNPPTSAEAGLEAGLAADLLDWTVWRGDPGPHRPAMRLEISAPFVGSLDGKRQYCRGEWYRKLRTCYSLCRGCGLPSSALAAVQLAGPRGCGVRCLPTHRTYRSGARAVRLADWAASRNSSSNSRCTRDAPHPLHRLVTSMLTGMRRQAPHGGRRLRAGWGIGLRAVHCLVYAWCARCPTDKLSRR